MRRDRRIDNVEIKQHPRLCNTHFVAIVTTRDGYCYACTYADKPEEKAVRKAWRESNRDFLPYNTSEGVYC